MVKFGKRSTPTAGWSEVPAEIRDVKYGLVHTTDSGVGGMYESHSSTKKVFLQVEPPGAAAYEATLKIERGGPSTPDIPGTRVDVLVDPSDPQQVALPDDPTFTLPGGRTWQPEHGLAGALADASRRGDAHEIMRLTAEIDANAPPAPPRPPRPRPMPSTSSRSSASSTPPACSPTRSSPCRRPSSSAPAADPDRLTAASADRPLHGAEPLRRA